MSKRKRKGSRYEKPPVYHDTEKSPIRGVWVEPGEEVDWEMGTSRTGKPRIVGYKIRKKKNDS